MAPSNTTTKKRLPGTVLVQQASIEQASSLLEQLPEKPKEVWSLREAIDLLKDSISSALARGYTHEEVAAMLADKNIKISVSSLKRYLAATKRDRALAAAGQEKRPRRGGRPPRAAAAELSEPVMPEPVSVAEPAVADEFEPAPTPKKRGPRPGTPRATKAKTADAAKPATSTRPTSTRGRKKAT